jgi:chromosome segregation ATPase
LAQERLERDIDSLKQKCRTLESEKAKVQAELADAIKKTVSERKPRRKPRIESKIDVLEKLNADLNGQVESLKFENQGLKDAFDQLERRNADLAMELEASQKRSSEFPIAPPKKTPPVTPVVEFSVPTDAPPELAGILREISANQTVQASTKFQMALSSVTQYYLRKGSEEGQRLKTIEQDRDSIRGTFEAIIKEVATLIDAEDLRVNHIVEHQSERSRLWTALTAFRESHQKLVFSNKQFENWISQIQEKLHVSQPAQVTGAVDAAVGQIANLTEQLSQSAMMTRRLKRELQGARREFEAHEQRVNEQLKEFEQQVEKLSEQQRDAEHQARKDLEARKRDERVISKLTDEIEQTKNRLETQARDLANEYHNQIENIQRQYQQQISDLKAETEQLSNALQRAQDENAKLKKGVRVLRVKMNEKSEAGVQSRQEYEQTIAKLKREFENEVQASKNATAKLFGEISELKTEESRLVTSLKKLEAHNKHLVKQSNGLKRKVGQFESQASSQTDAANREKKLAEAKIKSMELNTETKIAAAVAAAKSDAENDKRRVISILADEFRSFFDPHEQIDLVTCQRTLHRAREELTRVNEELDAIKRIVGAAPGQSAADAVAQIAFAKR